MAMSPQQVAAAFSASNIATLSSAAFGTLGTNVQALNSAELSQLTAAQVKSLVYNQVTGVSGTLGGYYLFGTSSNYKIAIQADNLNTVTGNGVYTFTVGSYISGRTPSPTTAGVRLKLTIADNVYTVQTASTGALAAQGDQTGNLGAIGNNTLVYATATNQSGIGVVNLYLTLSNGTTLPFSYSNWFALQTPYSYTLDLPFADSQIQYLTPAAVASLTPNYYTVGEVAYMTPEAVKAFGAASMSLFGANAAGLTGADIAALPSNYFSHFTNTAISAFTADAASGLTFIDIQMLPTVAISYLSPAAFGGLTSSAINGLNAAEVGALTPGQEAALNTNAAGLTIAHLAALTSADTKNFSAIAIRSLNSSVLGAMTAAEIQAMTTAQLAGIGTNAIGMTTTELINISTDQIQALTTIALNAIESSTNHTALIQAIQTDVLLNMTTSQLHVLHQTDMTAAQITALGTLQSYLI